MIFEFFIFLLFCVLFCGVISAMVARGKGRSGCGWFVIGVLLGPLGLIASFVIGADKEGLERKQLRSGKLVKCPQCAELIKAEAKVCRHCGAKADDLSRNHGDDS
jgi:hypothetical protein